MITNAGKRNIAISALAVLFVLCALGSSFAGVYGVRIADLGNLPQAPNPIRIWGRVIDDSPVTLHDGRAQARVIGVTAPVGANIAVTGDWDGTVLRAATSTGTLGVESLHMGYNSGYPTLTDALRLSKRIGCVWWSKEKDYFNPENGYPIPYAYHDGYFNQAGRTPEELAARWNQILKGGGDPWVPTRMPGEANYPGNPTVIVLDEVGGGQSDANGGRHLHDALAIYCSTYGTREDIMAYLSPGVTQTSTPANYSYLIAAAQNYLRKVCLELYLSHESYVTGNNNSGLNPAGQKGDAYLNGRLGNPIRRWINAGVPASRVMPILSISMISEAHGATTKEFYKFLNRQFWWMANGRYGNNLTGDQGIITAMRNGVGSYTWRPDTDGAGPYSWRTSTTQTTLDTYFEKYIMWYCVGGNTNAHSDGIDAQ